MSHGRCGCGRSTLRGEGSSDGAASLTCGECAGPNVRNTTSEDLRREAAVLATWPADQHPTPSEWAEWFALLPISHQEAVAERVLTWSTEAAACFLGDHETRIGFLADRLDAMTADRDTWKQLAINCAQKRGQQ